ncbi:amidase family protein [Haloarchaeobius iranensis]|uniref:amidase family protein n=1 Tax=Haloarchaeobius iranensis TaxID=996166 RepID=UPI00362D125F
MAELEAAGATAEEVSLAGYPTMGPAVGAIAGMEFAAFVGANGASYSTGTGTTAALREALAAANERGEFGENVAGLLVTNGVLAEGDGAEYVAAKGMQRQFSRTVGEALEDYDVLVMPTTRSRPPSSASSRGWTGCSGRSRTLRRSTVAGRRLSRSPVARSDGKPVGLQVVADWNDETTALRVAGAVESL